ncbi:hypothetical protein GCM10011498_32740 [Amylibacter cionae]|uniref:Uncharacterized protein n=1 Tax=Neptunicoccus cionae TaxID=2035344 RepID=A0A916R2I3_9RHOB|nr:hypothetical protein GCM10011498_32740 [Amylibacter cionae]
MFIVYITLGIISGIFAAIATLVSGAGILMAIAAYMFGGIVGVSASALWLILARNGFTRHPSPSPHAQRIPQSRFE